MTALRQRMLEDLQIRPYSPTTILYLLTVAEFAQHSGQSPDQLGADHIRRFQLFLSYCLPLPLPSVAGVGTGGIGSLPSNTNVNTRAAGPGRAITDTYCFPSSM